MPLVRHADQRVTTTPHARMTTIASPSQGGAQRSVWQVEMAPGQTGPEHAMDGEQVWWVERGGLVVTRDDTSETLGPGDAVVLAASVRRRLAAHPTDGVVAVVCGDPGAHASLPDGTDRGVPPWAV